MTDPPCSLKLQEESPGTRNGPGLSSFLAPTVNRLKTIFKTLLLPKEQARLVELLHGPRCAELLDKRLLALGLARKVLGKVVATDAARQVAMRDRFEIRRGSDARHLVSAAMLETDTVKEALSIAWAMARRDVGSRWQSCLVLEPVSGGWTIFLPTPRAWPGCSIRPYVLCLMRL